jgi:hypothetical protein
MAKLTKAMGVFAKEAMKAEIEKVERPKKKYGVFNNALIETIKNPESKQEVSERYDAYIDAVEQFNKIRDQLTLAKFNLQNILDTPLSSAGLVSSIKHWEIYKVDTTGNVYYRDSDTDYKVKFLEWFKHDINKTEELLNLNAPNWDFLDKDIPQLVDFPTDDGTEGTVEGTSTENEKDTSGLADNLQPHLQAYRALNSSGERLEYVMTDNLSDTERSSLFNLLEKKEQKELYRLLQPEDQDLVKHLLKK